jgi:hypothetical protein
MLKNSIKGYNIRIRKMLTKANKAQVKYPDFVQNRAYLQVLPISGYVFNPRKFKEFISFTLVGADFVLNCYYSFKTFGDFFFESKVKYYFLGYITVRYDQSIKILVRPISRDFYLFARGYWNLFRTVVGIGYNVDEKINWDKAFNDVEECVRHNIIGKDLTKSHYWNTILKKGEENEFSISET